MTIAATVPMLRDELARGGRNWWVCRCGRHLDRHSMRTVPSSGGREYVCSLVASGRYEASTLPELDYTPEKGLHRP